MFFQRGVIQAYLFCYYCKCDLMISYQCMYTQIFNVCLKVVIVYTTNTKKIITYECNTMKITLLPYIFKRYIMNPGSAAQWVEHQTENQRLLVQFQVRTHTWVEARSPLGEVREAMDQYFSQT